MKRKNTGLIGLYSGRKIKAMAAKGERLTPSQTAKQALRAIKKKYNNIVDSAKYYHAGRGNWVMRSIKRDKKTTSKVTIVKAKWRRQPHKFDYPGIDTGPGHKTPSNAKLINYSLRNRAQLLKSTMMGERGGKNVKVAISGQTTKVKYTDGPSIDKLTKTTFPSIVKMCKDDIYKAYKISVPSKDFLILVDRSFSPTVLRYVSNTGDDTFDLNTKSVSRDVFNKIKSSPKSKPSYGKLKPEAKGRYRYGSFMRPLWAGFTVSVPFKIVSPRKSDEDPKRGRLPHTVIVTNEVIPKKELEYFELTDIRDIKKFQEIYKYIESLDIADRHKGHLRRLYNTRKLKTKTDINKLAKKVEKPKRPTKLKLVPPKKLKGPVRRKATKKPVAVKKKPVLKGKPLGRPPKFTKPKEAPLSITGVNIKELSGAKLKKPLGLYRAVKRYHTKNMSGGSFAIELRFSSNMGDGIELSGAHDPTGTIRRLEVGPLYSPGSPIITNDNYKEMTFEKVITVVKKAIGFYKKSN